MCHKTRQTTRPLQRQVTIYYPVFSAQSASECPFILRCDKAELAAKVLNTPLDDVAPPDKTVEKLVAELRELTYREDRRNDPFFQGHGELS